MVPFKGPNQQRKMDESMGPADHDYMGKFHHEGGPFNYKESMP